MTQRASPKHGLHGGARSALAPPSAQRRRAVACKRSRGSQRDAACSCVSTTARTTVTAKGPFRVCGVVGECVCVWGGGGRGGDGDLGAARCPAAPRGSTAPVPVLGVHSGNQVAHILGHVQVACVKCAGLKGKPRCTFICCCRCNQFSSIIVTPQSGARKAASSTGEGALGWPAVGGSKQAVHHARQYGMGGAVRKCCKRWRAGGEGTHAPGHAWVACRLKGRSVGVTRCGQGAEERCRLGQHTGGCTRPQAWRGSLQTGLRSRTAGRSSGSASRAWATAASVCGQYERSTPTCPCR